MLSNRQSTLHITQLSPSALNQLSPSFFELPNTDHADGQYRLRRYSVIQFHEGKVIEQDKNVFMQTGDINRFQGNVIREFEPLLSTTLHSEGMREMCEMFVETNQLPDGQEIEIHQIRISAVYDETQVAPEGVHQDGFDHIAIIGVSRHNIVGGEIMLYNQRHEAPFYRQVLNNGAVAILDDARLWHNASPIRAIKRGERGHMDVFVLTAKGGKNALQS